MGIYLDYAASTPLNHHVKDWIITHLDVFGNPSSTHQQGQLCREIIDDARNDIADYMAVDSSNIIFTSGASQANSLALTYNVANIFESKIEHSSIKEWIKYHESRIGGHPISVDNYGFIDLEALERTLSVNKAYSNLIVVQWANNEIGTIQDIDIIADLAHQYGARLFVDATQIFPWIKSLDLTHVIDKIDMLSASAHKCGGMQGVGILYKKPDIKLKPVVFGHQEQGLVGGTENTLGIGSFGEAVKHVPSFSSMMRIIDNRNYLYEMIHNKIPGVQLNGPGLGCGVTKTSRLPNNLNISIGGVRNDVLIQLLDSMGIYCSAGSACNSHNLNPSHVLKAIGLKDSLANSSIRFSIDEEFDVGASILLVKRLEPLVRLIRQSK